MSAFKKRFNEDFRDVFAEEIKYLIDNSLMYFQDDDIFILTEYGSHHIYGIIPLFYSERSKVEMFDMARKILNPSLGEKIYLDRYDRKQYEAPSVAADLVVFSKEKNKILLITRGNHPYANCLALPGGFYAPDDDKIENCAVRELAEETGIDIKVSDLSLLKVSSGKNRDPRGWIVSVAYVVVLKEEVEAIADSDAIMCKWYEVNQLDVLEFAFDHKVIIDEALKRVL